MCRTLPTSRDHSTIVCGSELESQIIWEVSVSAMMISLKEQREFCLGSWRCRTLLRQEGEGFWESGFTLWIMLIGTIRMEAFWEVVANRGVESGDRLEAGKAAVL